MPECLAVALRTLSPGTGPGEISVVADLFGGRRLDYSNRWEILIGVELGGAHLRVTWIGIINK